MKIELIAADWGNFPLYYGSAVFSMEGIALVLPIENAMAEPEKFGRVLRNGCIGVTALLSGAILCSLCPLFVLIVCSLCAHLPYSMLTLCSFFSLDAHFWARFRDVLLCLVRRQDRGSDHVESAVGQQDGGADAGLLLRVAVLHLPDHALPLPASHRKLGAHFCILFPDSPGFIH